MEWFVYRHNVNKNKIEAFNIFDHYGFVAGCKKTAKKIKERDAFEKEIRGNLFYHFCSKYEYETVVTTFPMHDGAPERKIDIYEQVMMNRDVFMDYVWNNRNELKKIGE